MFIAAVNAVPQIIVVILIALFFGWTPSFLQIAAILLALLIVAVLATGLGLLFGAINVTFRDAQSFVEIIVMCAVWASPVMYQWEMVAEQVPDWLFIAYRLNPLTAAVELFHYGIWLPLDPAGCADAPRSSGCSRESPWSRAPRARVGQMVFRRLEGRFAQDL